MLILHSKQGGVFYWLRRFFNFFLVIDNLIYAIDKSNLEISPSKKLGKLAILLIEVFAARVSIFLCYT